MAFAGWYRDAAFREPCGVGDVDGFAYAKFVKVADLLTFRGCSFSERGAAPTKNAGLRFSYDITAPVGSSFVGMGMYGRFADKPEDRTFNQNTGSLRTDGHSDSNIVLNSMKVEYYERPYVIKAFVKYTTADGTTVEAVEGEYHAGTMAGIADAVLSHPMATQADRDYAAAIKAATKKEQSPASGE